MTYLGRQVFDIGMDWKQVPVVPYGYDLQPLALGQSVRFEAKQEKIERGFEFILELTDADKIAAFETFLDTVKGPLKAFWLPHPMGAMDVVDNVDGFQFRIKDQGLTALWEDNTSIHVAARNASGTLFCTNIEDVTDVGDNEEVQVNDALTIDETWRVNQLALVRFVGEVEYSVVAEGWKTARVRVLELPLEYDAANDGETRVWLYRLKQDYGNGTVVTTRLTSYNRTVNDGTNDWLPFPITHGSIKLTTRADRDETTLNVVRDEHESALIPFADMIPFPTEVPITVEILEAIIVTGDTCDVPSLVWAGKVATVSASGNKLDGKCAGVLDALNGRFPAMFMGPRCNYVFGTPGTCDFDIATIEQTGPLGLIPGVANMVTVGSAGAPIVVDENELVFGYLDTGAGSLRERRQILANSASAAGVTTLTLLWPLRKAVAAQDATVVPGCALTPDACKAYDNYDNYGGHPHIPGKNLALQAIENQNPEANKK